MSKRHSAGVLAAVVVLLAPVVLLAQGCASSSSLSGDPSDADAVSIDDIGAAFSDALYDSLVLKDLAIYEAVVVHYYNYNVWRYEVQARASVKDGGAFLCLLILFFDPPDEFLVRLNSRGVLVRRGTEFRKDLDEVLFLSRHSVIGEQDDKHPTVIVGSFYQEYERQLLYHLVEAEDGWDISFSHELGELCDRCIPGLKDFYPDGR